jgi:hypothetical protein
VAHLASLARYVTTGSLWAITLAVALVGDRAPRRLHTGLLTVTTGAATAVTAAFLVDELAWRHEDRTTESCLAALKIDQALQADEKPGRHLRAAGRGGNLSGHCLKLFRQGVI